MKNSITCLPGKRQPRTTLLLKGASKPQLLITYIISDGEYPGNKYPGESYLKENSPQHNYNKEVAQ